MNASVHTDSDRVTLKLKTLIDLARPAASLTFRTGNIQGRQSGNYLSKLKGRGMIFDETRLYQPGDDVRRMDWRVTARTDKPHSKVFKEERERPLFISVDYRPAMYFASRGVFKSVQAARVAALLAWVALKAGDKIGGQIFSADGCLELKPQMGKSSLLHFFNALVHPAYTGQSGNCLEQVLARLNHHARPGSQVVIISDFRGYTVDVDRHLANLSRHCELVLVQIVDPLEAQLPTKGRYRFTDSLREIFVDTADKKLLSDYQQRFQDRQQQLQHLCRRLCARWLICSTTLQPIEILGLFHGKLTAKAVNA